MRSHFLTVMITALFAGSVSAQSFATKSSESDRGDEIHAENCMVGYIQRVNIPALSQGRLTEIKIEEGVTVEKDELVAIIDDTQAKLNLDLKKAELVEAELKAADTVNLRHSQNAEKLAVAEAEAYKELRKEGATPYWDMERKRLEALKTKLQIEMAEMNIKIAKSQYYAKESEMKMAEDEVTRRQIRAPFAGFIETRIAQLGEWVQAGSPIATLIEMDRLRVEGDIDALRYSGRVTIGTPAKVLIHHRSDDNPITISAKIGYVSTEIDLNNRYRVWVTVDNTRVGLDWLIKPGMRAEIIIGE